MGLIAVLLTVCLCLLPCTALAVTTSDAKEPLLTNQDCSLTIAYRYDTAAFSGLKVKLYRIAEVSEKAYYTLAPSFASSGLVLNGIQTSGEWKVIRSTLESYILANKIEPMMIATTDAAGTVSFTGLQPGMYFAAAVDAALDDVIYAFDSALFALPGLSTEGIWQYQVSSNAKPQVVPPVNPDEVQQFKVLKLWKGDEGRTDRPKKIEVEIYRNAVLAETVILSEENHWSYTWSAKDDGAKWSVIERNVPSGYTMTLEQRETTFILTNSRTPSTPGTPNPPDTPDTPDTPGTSNKPSGAPPKTGDTSNLLFYALLMFISGTLLVLLGIAGKRNRHK